MSISIKELQAILEQKGGATLSSTSLQSLKTLLNNLGSARGNTVPADSGQHRSGITCTGHDSNKFPYSGGLSLNQLLDHAANLKTLTCSSQTSTAAFCPTRTATYDNVGCTCASRTSVVPCACDTQTDQVNYCGSRTATYDTVCTCYTRTNCTCVNKVCVALDRSCTDRCDGCTCESYETYPCTCYSRVSVAALSCDCYSRSLASCTSRTATYDNTNCTCASRTSIDQCQCNARCSCNTETIFA